MERHLGIYVHVPFCLSRCSYCSFHSQTLRKGGSEAYMRALHRELEMWEGPLLPVSTVYVGGGTPTVLPVEFLASVMAGLERRKDLSALREATLEANPATVEPRGLSLLRRAGFNRLSLGVQSLHRSHLRTLGRPHGPREAHQAFTSAREAGFSRISVDLMYGIPGQSPRQLEDDLRRVIDWGAEHISLYELTLHEGTTMARLCAGGEVEMPGEGEIVDMHTLASGILARAGYVHYEVSSYALGSEEISLHNSDCWSGQPYLGLGPSAHSFDGHRRRWWNLSDTAHWSSRLIEGRLPPRQAELLSPLQRAMEMAMLGLRTAAGLSLDRVRSETGLIPANAQRLARWRRAGLILRAGNSIIPTEKGMLQADGIASSIAWKAFSKD